MLDELTYILDDTLEMQYGYGKKERKRILRALLANVDLVKQIRLRPVNCFLLDNTLVCLTQEADAQVDKVFCWNTETRDTKAVAIPSVSGVLPKKFPSRETL